jgi:hypothetical protein
VKRKLPPLSHLQGVLTVIDNRAGRSPTAVLAAVREMVQDAIAVLQEPDPLKQRLAFIVTAIVQSTEIRTYQRSGKTVTLAKITDPALYHWAIAQVHDLAGSGR